MVVARAERCERVIEGNLADDWPPLRTLTDLALRHWNLRVTCGGCGRTRVVSGAAAWWLFHRRGWSDDVREASSRFVCTECGRRGQAAASLAKTRDAASDQSLPMPDEREWKRLVSRYRS